MGTLAAYLKIHSFLSFKDTEIQRDQATSPKPHSHSGALPVALSSFHPHLHSWAAAGRAGSSLSSFPNRTLAEGVCRGVCQASGVCPKPSQVKSQSVPSRQRSPGKAGERALTPPHRGTTTQAAVVLGYHTG